MAARAGHFDDFFLMIWSRLFNTNTMVLSKTIWSNLEQGSRLDSDKFGRRCKGCDWIYWLACRSSPMGAGTLSEISEKKG